jgi:ABC-type thiamine transport system ATPase subunit
LTGEDRLVVSSGDGIRPACRSPAAHAGPSNRARGDHESSGLQRLHGLRATLRLIWSTTRLVAVLFQDFNRYALTAVDNIHLGVATREPELADIRAPARPAGADEFLSAPPEGYDTILSPQFGKGLDLSLGQWQRVALARAFFRDAPLVILDEPTASLDARAERALFDSVRGLYRDKTVLLISHRFATVRSADRIVVLNDGRSSSRGATRSSWRSTDCTRNCSPYRRARSSRTIWKSPPKCRSRSSADSALVHAFNFLDGIRMGAALMPCW